MPKMPIKSGPGLNLGNAVSIDHLFQQAISLHRQGDLKGASQAYEQILIAAPKHFDATHLLAVVNAQRGDTERARTLFTKALAITPGHPEVHFNRGTMEREADNAAAAIADFDLILSKQPDHKGALTNRSIALQTLRRFDDAIADSDRLLELTPENPVIWNNRANLLLDCMRVDDALACINKAIKLDPSYYEALNNRGNIFKELQIFDKALADYDKALSIRPDFGDAHFNKAMLLLLKGDFETGWRLWEWRWKQQHLPSTPRDFQQPQWVGEGHIAGKTILLHSEQGLGDTVQFIRYAPLVAEHGATVIVEAPSVLHPLLGSVSGIDRIIDRHDNLPDFDLHCPMMSLPLAMRTTLETVPRQDRYFSTPPSLREKWTQRLGSEHKPRIALAWRGNPDNTDDHNRSMRLEEIAPHLSDSFEWICLHHDLGRREKRLAGTINHLSVPLDADTGLDDAAALCDLADLVVTVDTSFAHIAGALGKPVFVMLKYTPDFRWMMHRGDSPWYDSMTLFRQQDRGQWEKPIRDIMAALKARFRDEDSADQKRKPTGPG